MRRLLTLLVAGGVLAGCGGDEPADAERVPGDLRIDVARKDGSVAPPSHAEIRVVLDAEGRGRVAYVPDYPGRGVPTYRASFAVEPGLLRRVFRRVLSDVERRPSDDVAPGGGSAEVRVRHDRVTVADTLRADAVAVRLVEGLVPSATVRRFRERREAYALRRYGRRP